MPRKSRTTPGLVTVVSPILRIRNGDVDSLRKLRKRGRPKKLENLIPCIPSIPDYPQFQDVKDSEISFKDQFRVVRSEKDKNRKRDEHRSLQQRFDDLCSEVRIVDRFDSLGQVSRIEWSVPGSFCNCKSNTDDEYMSCLAHGLKQPDCDCGGIDGLNGYRTCAGHRSSGQMPGVRAVKETDRMRAAKQEADKVARELGYM